MKAGDDAECNISTEDNLLVKILKNVILSCIIYFIGYMNFCITWVILPIAFGVISEERKIRRLKRSNFARKAGAGREKEIILDNIGDFPAWVFFPDVERAEWANKIIKQCWPFVNCYTKDLIKATVEATLKKNLEKYALKGFSFERIVLGNVPFRTGGVIVYDNVSRDEVIMDVDVSYAGDCDIKFRLSGLMGGIKNFQLYGKLRLVLKPLIRKLPLIGGLQFFFLNNPDIDFEVDGIAGILDIPGINESLRKCVISTISSLMVLPNKFPIKLSEDVSSEKLKTPNPAGVLRVHVVQAKDLLKKDISFTGKRNSDPYAVLVVGDQTFKTKTIECTVNPKWDNWCEFVILEFNGQNLVVNVWDEDPTEDEFLGRTAVDISTLIKAKQSDLWLDLEEVKHGRIQIRCTWMTLTVDYSDLQAAIYESQQLQLAYISSALLIVYIDSATNLRQVKTSTKPDPYVQLQMGRQMKHTNSIMRTINPVWEESFIFFVNNPDTDYINLKIMDMKTDTQLNEFTYSLAQLADKDNLETVKEPVRLESGRVDCKLIWSLYLRIFRNDNFQEYLEKRSSTSSTSSKKTLETRNSDCSLSSDTSRPSSDMSESNTDSARSSLRSNTSYEEKGLSQEFMGQISLTMRYSLQRQRLIVVVHALSNLYYEDPTEDKDIYVKLYLLPEKSKATKRKTKVMKNCLNPKFEKRFEFLVSQDELNSKKLEISVIEEKILKNEIIGKTIIDLEKLSLPHTGHFDFYAHD